MDKNIMLHHLRNPYSVDELEMRKVRLQAADELERLYDMEEKIIFFTAKMETMIEKALDSKPVVVQPEVLLHHPV